MPAELVEQVEQDENVGESAKSGSDEVAVNLDSAPADGTVPGTVGTATKDEKQEDSDTTTADDSNTPKNTAVKKGWFSHWFFLATVVLAMGITYFNSYRFLSERSRYVPLENMQWVVRRDNVVVPVVHTEERVVYANALKAMAKGDYATAKLRFQEVIDAERKPEYAQSSNDALRARIMMPVVNALLKTFTADHLAERQFNESFALVKWIEGTNPLEAESFRAILHHARGKQSQLSESTKGSTRWT